MECYSEPMCLCIDCDDLFLVLLYKLRIANKRRGFVPVILCNCNNRDRYASSLEYSFGCFYIHLIAIHNDQIGIRPLGMIQPTRKYFHESRPVVIGLSMGFEFTIFIAIRFPIYRNCHSSDDVRTRKMGDIVRFDAEVTRERRGET